MAWRYRKDFLCARRAFLRSLATDSFDDLGMALRWPEEPVAMLGLLSLFPRAPSMVSNGAGDAVVSSKQLL
eukprot:CAMPEP_0181082874 /NCGR_PEP_ID=MMETSP1071-20121207/3855_1 /TAXON_ID=35127 /ORGANISM="Thalassiosira sp., Strain NH16" /LENGTH=70 /DNA_ID=CAMNT_0023164491 /DNA_START=49 /DNA_END=261 /DNA_ORIENTATION=-